MAVAGFTVLLALISLASSWGMTETLTRGLDGTPGTERVAAQA
jgi:hypothetical protein